MCGLCRVGSTGDGGQVPSDSPDFSLGNLDPVGL